MDRIHRDIDHGDFASLWLDVVTYVSNIPFSLADYSHLFGMIMLICAVTTGSEGTSSSDKAGVIRTNRRVATRFVGFGLDFWV